MNNLDEFDRAVLVSYDPTANADLKAKAIEYCNTVKNAVEGWKFCLEKFFTSKITEVQFSCLVVIQETIQYRHNALNPADQLLLKQSLMRYIREFLPSNTQNNDKVIRNKFAQVVALLFKVEYPQQWPSFFGDLLSTLSLGISSIDIFLRIMNNIDVEVIDKMMLRNTEEIARSTEIKDYMREHAIRDIAATWFSILDTYKTSNIEICNNCLENVQRYIDWIDIALIANDKFVPLFFQFLASEPLREKACDCIHALVDKGMPDPVAKLALINKLKLTTIFSNVSMEDDPDFLEQVAKIINTTGLELLECVKQVQTLIPQQKATSESLIGGQAMIEEALLMLFKFMNHEDDNVSSATFKFAYAYLQTLKVATIISPKQGDNITVFLEIIRNKLKYEEDFDFDKHDEEEQLFLELRKELVNLLKVVIQISTQMVAAFVHGTITAVTTNISTATFADVEVAVYLVLAMGDGIAEATLKSLESFFSEIMVILATSNISLYPHRVVTLAYFDTITRYIRYLPNNPEVLKNILISFFDGRGIRNPYPTIRSRVCYLFQRLVKSHLVQLLPFLPSIVQTLTPFAVISFDGQMTISHEDQINLFDAMGTLVGGAPRADQDTFLQELLKPLLSQMEEIIQRQLYKSDTPEKPVFTNFLLQIISCLGTFSKGFNGQKESCALFKKALEMILTLPGLLPASEEIRMKTLFYMHRMVECLGLDVLQYLPPLISQMLLLSNPKEFFEFLRLINQLMARFKEQMFNAVDALCMQIIERLYKFIAEITQNANNNANHVSNHSPNNPTSPKANSSGLSNGTAAATSISNALNPETKLMIANHVNAAAAADAEREIFEVKKQYYLFISTILASGLGNVLKSPTNATHLNQILRTVVEGCVDLRDVNVAKQCYMIFKKLVEHWAGNDANSLPGFNKFVYDEIAPILIKEPLKPAFDLTDGGINLILHENVAIQKAILAKCGEEFTQLLLTVLLPSLQLPREVSEQYVIHLTKDNPKEFKTNFANFISSLKKKT